jgi:enoyl-CoA hydratase/carnithine racemase
VTCQRKGPWAILTLDNPKKRNVLDLSTIRQLQAGLAEAGSDPGVKGIQVHSTGPVFSSGHDLKEVKDNQDCFQAIADLCTAIRGSPKPVVALCRGFATAAGCQLVAACTYSAALPEAKFACSGIKLGLFCSTPAVEVIRKVPYQKAMQLLLTGEPISALEAARVGLINKQV